MRHFLPALLLIALYHIGLSAQPGIRFKSDPDWESVMEDAKKDHKLIFLDCYTTWCGPCKKMEKEVFSRSEEGAFFNENFVCVKYDMERGTGESLKKQYGVNVFPTYLFLDWNGMLVHKIIGAHFEAGKFINYAKLALSPGDSYGALSARYRNGERSPGMMRKYLLALEIAGQGKQATEIARTYLTQISKDHFMDSSYWGMINYLMKEPTSREFKILYENSDEIAAVMGEKVVADKIFSMFEDKIAENEKYRVQEGALSFDQAAEEEMLEMLRNAAFPRANELLARGMAARAQRQGDWENLAYAADAMLDFDLLKDLPDPPAELHRHASTIATISSDGRLLRRALRWVNFACKTEQRQEVLTTYFATKATLLQHMGLENEAAEARTISETYARRKGKNN